ncbi:MAG: MFS transporter [Clostridia bacterium]
MEEKNKILKRGIRNVIFLGLISCFADISSEMVYPIIPLYLTTVLGATPAIVGVIEGIAESLASLLKVFSGYISDKYENKKKIAFAGYSTGLIYKITLLVSGSWFGILLARIIDRFGKGIRTAPRDVMVAESSEDNKLGKSFGIHKALDMLGSAIGILIAFLILKFLGEQVKSYRIVFIVSAIPIIIALCLFSCVKEKKTERKEVIRDKFWKNIGKLDNQLKLYLFVVFLFTLGNSSNTFLLLRASDVGFSSTNSILLYFIYNIVTSILAIPIGKRSDKTGRKKILVGGYILFSVVYLMFGFSNSKAMMCIAFVIYGIYTAMIAGVEKAFISEIAPKDLKGTMLGLHGTLVGIALLPASIIAGFLWENVNSSAPFIFGATLSLLSAMILMFGLKNEKKVVKEKL